MHTCTRLRAVALALAASTSAALAAAAPTLAAPTASAAATSAATALRPAAATAARHPREVSSHIMGRHRRHAGGKQQSLNWAGYIRGGTGLTSASGSWTVPTLTTTHGGYSSTWVGIDGATSGDRYLIQTGTEADVSGGRRTYRAWWEVITPSDVAPETVFAGLTIRPGDAITASVRKAKTGRWTMRLGDATTGHSASKTVSFAGPGHSAEWIQEDTDVNGAISTAPDWGSVTFHALKLNGSNPKLVASEAVDIVDSHGTREASTSAPTKSGNGFTVTWLAPGTKTPAG
ncbi:G1 family glutamic endopeptidase [uncultured Jatrophihabitans sp.]|uniref:G1 family glutamic endopeptidase n=1 Tax=uncultured Jatrophihabitans sp. TaxID=1610747 RepID=UPI0035CA51D1